MEFKFRVIEHIRDLLENVSIEELYKEHPQLLDRYIFECGARPEGGVMVSMFERRTGVFLHAFAFDAPSSNLYTKA